MKNIYFVPKDVQRMIASHKISEKYNEQKVFHKKNCSYKFRNIHRKTPVLESFLIKMQAFRPATLLKRVSNTGIFLTILRNF